MREKKMLSFLKYSELFGAMRRLNSHFLKSRGVSVRMWVMQKSYFKSWSFATLGRGCGRRYQKFLHLALFKGEYPSEARGRGGFLQKLNHPSAPPTSSQKAGGPPPPTGGGKEKKNFYPPPPP